MKFLQGKVQEAHQMLSYVTMSPPVIRRSLVISVLTTEGRLDDALDELEKCLHEEDVIFNSENSCVSNEAVRLRCLHKDRTKTMKRFRALQRVITDFDRRSSKSIDELLHSPLHVASTEEDFVDEPSKIPLTDKIIGQVPHFLSEEN
uniref:TPR_REGION domain-containing protein n=1 Tax=Angiostrongylus cantonensis TaxID=6313 RepID=A0A0K0D9F1_ANGCA